MSIWKLKLGLLIVAGMMPIQAIAGATAKATVTANIVPMVNASMTGSLMMTQSKETLPLSSSEIELTTTGTEDVARFKLDSDQSYAYSVSVSSIDVTNDQGNKLVINRFSVPIENVYKTSGHVHELQLKAVLDASRDVVPGNYQGQINFTVNFN